MVNLTKVDTFPELTRSGRVNEELQAIIDALMQSADNGDRFALSGVKAGKAYNSMQQRIRAQAKKFNFKVIIRYDAPAETLYFKATRMHNDPTSIDNKPEVKAANVKGIKSAKNTQTSNS